MVFTFCVPFVRNAKADALTLTMVAAGTYAVGNWLGVNFSAIGATGAGMQSMMETEITNYCGGVENLGQYFGTAVIQSIAGRLAIGQVCYNGILNFLRYLNSTLDLGLTPTQIGYLAGSDYYNLGEDVDIADLIGWYIIDIPENGYHRFYWRTPLGTDVNPGSATIDENIAIEDWVYTVSNSILGTSGYVDPNTGRRRPISKSLSFSLMESLTGIDYDNPVNVTSDGTIGSATVLNPTQSWEGDLGEDPDTNLEDLMQDIFDGAADIDLDVDGEIIDGPVPPEPTVVPQPTHAPVDDVIDGLNDLIEQQDTVIEGINDLVEGTDAIEDAIEDVKTDVGEIAETLEEATEVIEPEAAADYKFDLRNLFPFCIPFDIVRILQLFDVSPVAPHVYLPFVIDSMHFSYTFDLDFSAFNGVAAIMRGLELIVFAIGLAIVTSKVIRW